MKKKNTIDIVGGFQRWQKREMAKYSLEGAEVLESHSGEICPYTKRRCYDDGKCIRRQRGIVTRCIDYDGEGLLIECPDCGAQMKESHRFCKDCGWENTRI